MELLDAIYTFLTRPGENRVYLANEINKYYTFIPSFSATSRTCGYSSIFIWSLVFWLQYSRTVGN